MRRQIAGNTAIKIASAALLLLRGSPLLAATLRTAEVPPNLASAMQMATVGSVLDAGRNMDFAGGTLENQYLGLETIAGIANATAGDEAVAAVQALGTAGLFQRIVNDSPAHPHHADLYSRAGEHLVGIAASHPDPRVAAEAVFAVVDNMRHPMSAVVPPERLAALQAGLAGVSQSGHPAVRGLAGLGALALAELQNRNRGESNEFGAAFDNLAEAYRLRALPALGADGGSPVEPVSAAAGAPEGINIRHLRPADYPAVVAVQQKVWKFTDEDVMTPWHLDAGIKVGGQLIGAFKDGNLVGAVFGIAGTRDRRTYMHSQFMGVDPAIRDSGLGTALKLAQREDALARGIEVVEWTYDPTQLRNAHLNINNLGGLIRRYIVNHYGPPFSALHVGLPTDRFVVEWHLASHRVLERAGLLARRPSTPAVEQRITVPAQINAWRTEAPDRASRTFLEIREQFLRAFEAGLAVLGFEGGRDMDGTYLLGRPDPHTDFAAAPPRH